MGHGMRANDKGWLASELPQRLRFTPTERARRDLRLGQTVSWHQQRAGHACIVRVLSAMDTARLSGFLPDVVLRKGQRAAGNLPRPHLWAIGGGTAVRASERLALLRSEGERSAQAHTFFAGPRSALRSDGLPKQD